MKEVSGNEYKRLLDDKGRGEASEKVNGKPDFQIFVSEFEDVNASSQRQSDESLEIQMHRRPISVNAKDSKYARSPRHHDSASFEVIPDNNQIRINSKTIKELESDLTQIIIDQHRVGSIADRWKFLINLFYMLDMEKLKENAILAENKVKSVINDYISEEAKGLQRRIKEYSKGDDCIVMLNNITYKADSKAEYFVPLSNQDNQVSSENTNINSNNDEQMVAGSVPVDVFIEIYVKDLKQYVNQWLSEIQLTVPSLKAQLKKIEEENKKNQNKLMELQKQEAELVNAVNARNNKMSEKKLDFWNNSLMAKCREYIAQKWGFHAMSAVMSSVFR